MTRAEYERERAEILSMGFFRTLGALAARADGVSDAIVLNRIAEDMQESESAYKALEQAWKEST